MTDQKKTIEAEDFREAMSRLGASVNILASNGGAGRVGATVSAVCSVTDSPPTVLVCLNRNTFVNDIIKRNGVFSVNTLIHDHTDLSDAFAGRDNLEMDERFALADWQTLQTGSPVLKSARVAFDCEVSEISEVGTHSVLFGRVVAASCGDKNKALIYLDRNYHAL
ncbi:flavin reductase [Pseudovibrio sp. SPO723]|uniref:flavin reductase n=1 Tax=Nesiotobacter zosterae TaxID=392721 RepID=UPI0029C351FF|nr:flavin reductase [Pseudovibrio sp. SPO723]MDX5594658.1 flavin reductase [Pseudovibrio sp. SPO723]